MRAASCGGSSLWRSVHLWPAGGGRDVLVVLVSRRPLPQTLSLRVTVLLSEPCLQSEPPGPHLFLHISFLINVPDVWWVLLGSSDRWGGVTRPSWPVPLSNTPTSITLPGMLTRPLSISYGYVRLCGWVGPLFFGYGNLKIYIYMYAFSTPAPLMFYAKFKWSEARDIIAAVWMEKRIPSALSVTLPLYSEHVLVSHWLLKLFIHSERAAAVKVRFAAASWDREFNSGHKGSHLHTITLACVC